MPAQKPGKSRQDYCSPPELLTALKRKLGILYFDIDLAASGENTVAEGFYTEKENALVQPWGVLAGGWGYCNPPYANIKPWVEKAYYETDIHGAQTAMLVPASVGANWWQDWVHHHAYVLFMNGRVTFVGETTGYPKDTAILLYSPMTIGDGGYSVWNWHDKE